VVGTLPQEPTWAGKRVNYGKDRCAYVPRREQVAASAAQVAAAQSLVASQGGYNIGVGMGIPSLGGGDMANGGVVGGNQAGLLAAAAAAAQTGMNRTIYLGNIHPDTSSEDICNAVRGGVLQSIRYMPEKHIAFVTFVDASSAFQFFQSTTFHGLTINNRRVKIGWGKNNGGLPPNIAMAVHGGATRNVYIGNIKDEDWEEFHEERLRTDFGEFGEIELVNFFKEKNCAFVNFTNIANAIKAIEIIKLKPEYANLRVSHGKDRCANPPRIPTASGGGGKRNVPGSASTSGANKSGEENTANVDADGNLEDLNVNPNTNGHDLDAQSHEAQQVEHTSSTPGQEAGSSSASKYPVLSQINEHGLEVEVEYGDELDVPEDVEAEEFIPSEIDKEEVGKLVQEEL